MDASQIVLIIVLLALVVLAAALWQRSRARQREHLRERFGSEYDRAVDEAGSRRRAEQDLADRERRHAQLDIRTLPPARRQHFATEWTAAQTRFVDDPVTAVGDADRLVTQLLGERGYPTSGYQEQAAVLSVEHADVLDHYRSAHEVGARADQATTEELRRSMVHYRSLFDTLLHDGDDEAADEQLEPDRVTGTPRPASPPPGPAASAGAGSSAAERLGRAEPTEQTPSAGRPADGPGPTEVQDRPGSRADSPPESSPGSRPDSSPDKRLDDREQARREGGASPAGR
jgi:hypothetical protein